jgi:hypothetical protein
MTFQTTVNLQPAPAVAGDFASANIRANVLAGPFALVAGPNGLTVGRFAWLDQATYTLASNTGFGPPDGFVGRHMQGLITTFLSESSMLIPKGLPITLYNEGEFWVVNSGTNEVTPNMKAYANLATGLVTFGATGTIPQDWSMTGSIAALPGSATTSTIVDNVFTIGALASGNFYPGSTLSGTGVTAGTKIVSQLTGVAGGAAGATYLVTPGGQTVTSTTITGAAGTLTISAATTGTVHVGDTIVAGGGGNTASVAGTQVTAALTGTGGTGTYVVDNNTVVTSGTLVGNAAVETKWLASSIAAPGELVKMTSWPRG